MGKTNFGEFLRKLDFFGVPVTLSVDGRHKFTTKLGGVVSVIFALTCLIYGTYQGYILFNKLDTSFNQSIITNHYGERHVISAVENVTDTYSDFTTKTDFNIAFGFLMMI